MTNETVNEAREAAAKHLHRLVDDAWHERTKGDLMIAAYADFDDIDEPLAEIVTSLGNYATETIGINSAAQYDNQGNEIDEVDDRELARRIAAALDIVLYGGNA